LHPAVSGVSIRVSGYWVRLRRTLHTLGITLSSAAHARGGSPRRLASLQPVSVPSEARRDILGDDPSNTCVANPSPRATIVFSDFTLILRVFRTGEPI